jgi:uncharacterized protein YdaT
MPWTPKQFKDRHNKSLTPAQATKAAAQANAILRSGGSEAVAIATANKHAHDKPKPARGALGLMKKGK